MEKGKEIDMLAIIPVPMERFHVECKVSVSKGFRLREKDLHKIYTEKFAHPIVLKGIERYFHNSKYKRILVVGDVQNKDVIKKAKSLYKIEVWKISKLLDALFLLIGSSGSRDDVLRTLQLLRRWRNIRGLFHREDRKRRVRKKRKSVIAEPKRTD